MGRQIGRFLWVVLGFLFWAPICSDFELSAISFQPEAGTPTNLAQPLSLPPTEPKVTLQAASGATILFKSNNGRTIDNVPPQTSYVPHLVLYRNGTLTAANERTLIVTITGIPVPATPVTITIQVWTQHDDPDKGPFQRDANLLVWRESKQIHATPELGPSGATAVFRHEFTDATFSGTEWLATPTDYFRYDISITTPDQPMATPLITLSQDYALLMENQWLVKLPAASQAPEGAVPKELIIYYCDMFPFWQIYHDAATWLRRREVTDYIGAELAPALVEAFQTQTNAWDYPWNTSWTNSRPWEDTGQLSVALTHGSAWFHGRVPSRANSQIAIRASVEENRNYDTLTDSILSPSTTNSFTTYSAISAPLA